MATAYELLLAEAEYDEEILVVDLNTRVIAIPATLKVLGVVSDDDVRRLQFTIPRHYGEFDLSTFIFHVNFENARGQGDVYPVDDLTVDDDVLTFSWLIDRVAFIYEGDVKFSICMKRFDDAGMVIKELNTTVASLPVLEGLETAQALVEQNPSAFDQILYRLYAVEAATGNGQNGYYSVVRVDQTSDGATFTIVNQDGETVARITNGTDGYTPQKGVDYWTASDKNEIENEIVNQMNQELAKITPQYTNGILRANNWANDRQTISVSGVTANNMVYVAPQPDDVNYEPYTVNGVRCVSQGGGTLTFACDSVPDVDILVNISIYPNPST